MKRLLLAAAAAVSLPCLAQTYYEPPLSRGELAECMDRDAFLRERLDGLERERLANDRETDAISREGARLAEELRTLDSADPRAVATYNVRSQAHNRRVEQHNRKVADMNARAAMHNNAAADVTAQCASRPYYLRDRDALIYR
jgi:hypothetical protein